VTKWRLGTRGSALAIRQAELARQALIARTKDLDVELVTIKTSGDRLAQADLSQLGGKGLFVKEIEDALLAGIIDCAIHSLKDLPAEIPNGLVLAAFLEREDPRDVLISRGPAQSDSLPSGARVGTSSLRRRVQLLTWRPDLHVEPIRGNVDTRLRKLREGQFDAIVLALAGLHRLGLDPPHAVPLPPEVMLPAVGQGILVVETRGDNRALAETLADVDHGPSRIAAIAERAFLSALGGDCHTPMAAYARLENRRLRVDGLVATPDGSRIVGDRVEGPPDSAAELGRQLARLLHEAGGAEIVDPRGVRS